MKIDSSEGISTDLLNENDTQQSPSYSIKRNEDYYIHAYVMLKSPSFSAPEEFNHANIGPKVMKENSPNKIIMEHLNINSLRNKFEALQFVINRNLDILLSETKLDDLFPSAQFMLNNFSISYRLDRNSNGGGLLLCVREDVPSKFLKVKSDCNIESVCVEVNLRKRKWFINGSYNPNKSFLSNHLECLNRIIDEYSKLYQNLFFWGDFNDSVSEKCLE